MLKPPSDRGADRGSGPVTAVMVMGILALVFTIGLTALFAAASDERSSAQHAADAAALAGAQGVLEDIPLALSPGILTPADIPVLLGGACVQTGRVEAFRLAQANGASLTTYCYNAFTDEVSVTVRMNTTNTGEGTATAGAEAATTFSPGDCELDASFTVPTQAPSPDNDDDDGEEEPSEPPPPPPPPPPVNTAIDCGFGPLGAIFRMSSERFYFTNLAAELADLKPRLTA